MSPRPHEGPAEEGLSSSLLQIAHDPERVERLRSVMSGFCHRCRNSLNGIKMSLYLFRRGARGAVPECWGEIESMYQQVEQLFDRLQTIYRPMTVTMLRSPVDELIDQHAPRWRSWLESRGLGLHLDPPDSEVAGDFDPAQLGTGLDALAAWRAEVGRPGVLVRVGWEARNGSNEIRWREMSLEDRAEPPEHAGACTSRDSGTHPRRADPLALPVLARIVAAHGGGLHREPGPGFGIVIRWPQYRPAEQNGAA